VKSFRRRRVVDGISIEVHQGEVVGLLGQNGAGKTTTFYMVVGMLRPDSGQVWLGDRNISRMPMYHRARAGIGYLPQEASVFRKLTVEENLSLVLQMRRMSGKDRRQRMDALMEEFNVAHLRYSRTEVLSGGERRRVEIARALATNPKFILLDEPFTGVDPIEVDAIQEMVMDLKRKNIGVLITDHNVRETLATTDRSYIVKDGQIIASGTSDEIANDPLARKYYLGQDFSL
jgi:lipopolysaccharide export system ATP-binding protein